MKFLMILLPLIIISFSYVMFKKDGDIKKLVISFLLLWAIITLALVGNVMRAISPLFISHILAIAVAYGATIYYVLKGRLIWLALVAPVVTMFIYLIFVWIGNEHLPSIL